MFLIDMFNKKTTMPTPETALPGRNEEMPTAEIHFVSGRPLKGPYPEGLRTVYLGMGCFWGAERLLWNTPGVYVTAAGYQGGFTPNPTYQETVTGLTGHTEVVKVVYDPSILTLEALLKVFFEAHDPTQGMRQGNDIGTTYRSAIYAEDADDIDVAIRVRDAFQEALIASGRKMKVTTEIAPAAPFYYAEDYHQQYLAKNPNGYCGLRGTGVSCPLPAAV
ncbi:peptide-methionine (S)-S-oxide reductase MsrA [Rhizobium sp. S-51]|uniref:Peptide methionine sulfoxide reductase MsrA n=1 Tax=Rhizobium terricola TaxID=2728849 RepID=A0A7Y0AXE4_9HYPH|nr:peptide-methionine (S)-S-oxide reductase MsrA [Rhizobium terricola]NML75265.1 peptide-methionine (S)-S-oxide reductase MsrA [Rhizobium terricola]